MALKATLQVKLLLLRQGKVTAEASLLISSKMTSVCYRLGAEPILPRDPTPPCSTKPWWRHKCSEEPSFTRAQVRQLWVRIPRWPLRATASLLMGRVKEPSEKNNKDTGTKVQTSHIFGSFLIVSDFCLNFFFLFKASHLTLQVFIRFFSIKEFFEQKCDNKVFPCLFLQKQWSPCRSGRLMYASVLHKPPERCD